VSSLADFPEAVSDYALERGLVGCPGMGVFTQESHPLFGRLCWITYHGETPVFAQGRAVRDSIQPKYLGTGTGFSPEGASSSVWNINSIKEREPVLVCEGIISAFRAHGLTGLPSVALFGKVLSPKQASLIACRRPACLIFVREPEVTDREIDRARSRAEAVGLQFISTEPGPDPDNDPSGFLDRYEQVKPMVAKSGYDILSAPAPRRIRPPRTTPVRR
jgi:hypothetical protein